jgi:prepilin-type N-terminal cleavage/methylation domain-containing protein
MAKDGNGRRGFTFLELIIILIISGILAAIAVPKYISFQKEAELAIEKQQAASVKVGVNSYYIQSITSGRLPQYPAALDSANNTYSSVQNPFFGLVVNSPGVSRPRWRKLSSAVYQGSSGLFYFYSPSTGTFEEKVVISPELLSLLHMSADDVTLDLISKLISQNIITFANGQQLIGGSAVLTPKSGGEPSVNGVDTGKQTFALGGTVNAQITSENAGWASQITFGYYTIDASGNKVLHQIFKGSDTTGASSDLSLGSGSVVGFYFTTPQGSGYTYYSQSSANADGISHFKVYENTALNKVTFALEDTYGGGDKDYQDMVVTLSY